MTIMAGNGRPQKYHDCVEPYLAEIKKMALTMTEAQIAKTLGVSYSSFRKYKSEHEELREALKKGRRQLVMDLYSALIKRAKGFKYTEKKKIYEGGELVREEISEKYAQPDVAALNLALKNFDSENWANDPQIMELRRKELELRQQEVKNNDW